MFTLLCWLAIIIPDLHRKLTYNDLTDLHIALVIFATIIELIIFFNLPGVGFFKNMKCFSLKGSALEKVILENDVKVRQMRFMVFITTVIAVLAILSVLKRSEIFWSYAIFLYCTNTDIALMLATPEERSQFLQKYKKAILLGVVFLALFLWAIAYQFYDISKEIDANLSDSDKKILTDTLKELSDSSNNKETLADAIQTLSDSSDDGKILTDALREISDLDK